MGFSDGTNSARRLILTTNRNNKSSSDDDDTMFAAAVTTDVDGYNNYCSSSFSSFDLNREWKRCVQYALGINTIDPEYDNQQYEPPLPVEDNTMKEKKHQQPLALSIVNLVPNAEEEEEEKKKDHSDNDNDEMDMDDDDDDDDIDLLVVQQRDDPWTSTAIEIAKNVSDMSQWIQKKKYDYLSAAKDGTMSDNDAALIQSTVTSMTATTANEIESLRQLIQKEEDRNNNTQLVQHRTGIVQILMMRLREEIADPFAKLQKQRTRPAVRIYHNPLQCELTVPKQQKQHRRNNTNKSEDTTTAFDALMGDDDDDEDDGEPAAVIDQRFLPKRPSHKLQCNLLDSYDDHNNGVISIVVESQSTRPLSTLLHGNHKKRSGPSGADEDSSSPQGNDDDGAKRTKPSSPPRTTPTIMKMKQAPQQRQAKQPSSAVHVPQTTNDENTAFIYTDQSELENEAVQLALLRKDNEYDAVQKMEESMVNVTSLIGQFADLVSSQSENVHGIHDTTAAAAKDVDKGKQQLVEAKERTQRSRHYMATAITAMGIMLLFINYVKP